MGDRTTVNILIRKEDYKKLLKAVGGTKKKLSDAVGTYDDLTINEDTVNFLGYEINYAEWGELEGLLKKHDIPYDKQWEAGYNYSEGVAYSRKIDNVWVYKVISSVDEAVVRVLHNLLRESDIKKAMIEYLAKYSIDNIEPLVAHFPVDNS